MSNAAPPTEGRIHEFTTKSGADTIEVGRKLARLLKAPQLLILRGELGTGKDHAGEGDCAGAGRCRGGRGDQPDVHADFTEYDGALDGKPVKLFHLDVYRLEGERQLETLGIDELLTPDALVLVEWGREVQEHPQEGYGGDAISSAVGIAEDYGYAEE